MPRPTNRRRCGTRWISSTRLMPRTGAARRPRLRRRRGHAAELRRPRHSLKERGRARRSRRDGPGRRWPARPACRSPRPNFDDEQQGAAPQQIGGLGGRGFGVVHRNSEALTKVCRRNRRGRRRLMRRASCRRGVSRRPFLRSPTSSIIVLAPVHAEARRQDARPDGSRSQPDVTVRARQRYLASKPLGGRSVVGRV